MKSYQINDLERLTGIKAHTIRIWEKRYDLIRPQRTDTNRRSYDDDQLRKLLNVTTLLSHGYKISKVAALTNEELENEIVNRTDDSTNEHQCVSYTNDMINFMLAFDERGIEKIFSAAVLRMGVYETMMKVVYPFLQKTGVLWSVNKTAPVQEHFATNIIRHKLLAASDPLLPNSVNPKTFVLFLPPGEWHEIGLLFANYILRAQGAKTFYLGQNVPVDNIGTLVEYVKPDCLLTLFTAQRQPEEVVATINTIASYSNDVKFYVAGNISNQTLESVTAPNVVRLNEVAALFDII